MSQSEPDEDNADDLHETCRALTNIARLLNVPVSAFLSPASQTASASAAETDYSERHELMRLYADLGTEDRRAVLAYARRRITRAN